MQPEQPVQSFGASRRIFWQQVAEFFCQVQQNIAGFKYAQRRIHRVVTKCRNFRVRVHVHETAGELIALADAAQPRIIFRTRHAERQ
ncbi:hypothetical protein D3C86_1784190 [compost metagenome]